MDNVPLLALSIAIYITRTGSQNGFEMLIAAQSGKYQWGNVCYIRELICFLTFAERGNSRFCRRCPLVRAYLRLLDIPMRQDPIGHSRCRA